MPWMFATVKRLVRNCGKSVVDSELPVVGGTARLHEDQAGGKTAELRLVRVRHDSHRIDPVGRQPEAREVGRRIEEGRGPDLETRLVGAASVDAFAGRGRDHRGEQSKRGIDVSARRQRLCLGVRHRLGRRKRARRRKDRRRDGDDVDPLGHRRDRQVDRNGDHAARRDCDRALDRFESIERCRDAVHTRREIANLYVARFVGDLFGQLCACGVLNENKRAGQKDRSTLRRDGSFNRAVHGGRRLGVRSRRAPARTAATTRVVVRRSNFILAFPRPCPVVEILTMAAGHRRYDC